jgi:L-iditol 2-dehydrogenase
MGAPDGELGAVAEFRVVPAENCFPIPAGMTLDEAALVEPLSVGLHAVRLAELPPAARIGILGAGPIGLSVLLCAKAAGGCTAYVTDLLDQRLAVARACGADWAGNATHGEAAAAILQKEPQGLDVVFECSGDPMCVDEGQKLLAPGGTLMLVGIPPTNRVIFDAHRMRRKELVFKSVRRQRNCVGPVIEMMAAGQLDPRPLLTHRFPLDRIAEAFDLVARYGDGVVKAVIELTSPLPLGEG